MADRIFLFDIGNVLMDFDFQVMLERIATDSGRPVSPPSEQDLENYHAVEKGLLSDEEYLERLNTSRGVSWTLEELIGVWQGMFQVNRTGYALFREAVERGLPVYTLSNIAAHHIEAIERKEPGFFDGAAGLFLSYQMGVRKPHPDIYIKALTELGVDGEQCLFVDDLPENIDAAREAGINAHQFVPENHDAVHKAVRKFFG